MAGLFTETSTKKMQNNGDDFVEPAPSDLGTQQYWENIYETE